MKICSTCGNEYENALEITYRGNQFNFDSFECAIHLLAPVCESCGQKVIGHGTEQSGMIFCSDHCKRQYEDDLTPDRSVNYGYSWEDTQPRVF